ncbi:hypothetical protein EV714DRAFT_278170 [Schizophyllum commune]
MERAHGVSQRIKELEYERDTASQKLEINGRHLLNLRKEVSEYGSKLCVEEERRLALEQSIEELRGRYEQLEQRHSELETQLDAAKALHVLLTDKAQGAENAIAMIREQVQTWLVDPSRTMNIDGMDDNPGGSEVVATLRDLDTHHRKLLATIETLATARSAAETERDRLSVEYQKLQTLLQIAQDEGVTARTERDDWQALYERTENDMQSEIEKRAHERLEEMQVQGLTQSLDVPRDIGELEGEIERLEVELQQRDKQLKAKIGRGNSGEHLLDDMSSKGPENGDSQGFTNGTQASNGGLEVSSSPRGHHLLTHPSSSKNAANNKQILDEELAEIQRQKEAVESDRKASLLHFPPLSSKLNGLCDLCRLSPPTVSDLEIAAKNKQILDEELSAIQRQKEASSTPYNKVWTTLTPSDAQALNIEFAILDEELAEIQRQKEAVAADRQALSSELEVCLPLRDRHPLID